MGFFSSIRAKIWLCVGLGFLGFALATAVNYVASVRFSASLKELRSVEFPLAMQGAEVLTLFKKQKAMYEEAVLVGDEDAIASAEALGREIGELMSRMALPGHEGEGPLRQLAGDFGSYAEQAPTIYRRLAKGESAAGLIEQVQRTGKTQQALLERFEALSTHLTARAEEQVAENSRVAERNGRYQLILFLVALVITAAIARYVANHLLIRPIEDIRAQVALLGRGEVEAHNRIVVKAGGEIGELAQELNGLADSMLQRSQLAQTIAEGNLDTEVSLASQHDILGQALQGMVASLGGIAQRLHEASPASNFPMGRRSRQPSRRR